uniref:Secreted protein n=1 Tax=Romanomermis culicivorax TaxID=13658 RepID=A0A915KBV2_ROMCU
MFYRHTPPLVPFLVLSASAAVYTSCCRRHSSGRPHPPIHMASYAGALQYIRADAVTTPAAALLNSDWKPHQRVAASCYFKEQAIKTSECRCKNGQESPRHPRCPSFAIIAPFPSSKAMPPE